MESVWINVMLLIFWLINGIQHFIFDKKRSWWDFWIWLILMSYLFFDFLEAWNGRLMGI